MANIFQERITPEKPKVLGQERIFVYVPKASTTQAGIASFKPEDFTVDTKGKVSIIWPYAHQYIPGLVNVQRDSEGYLKFTDDNNHYLQVDSSKINEDITTAIETHNNSAQAHPIIRTRLTNLENGKLDKSVTENGVTSTFDRYSNIGGGLNNRPYIRSDDTNTNSSAEIRLYSTGSQELIQLEALKMGTPYNFGDVLIFPSEIDLQVQRGNILKKLTIRENKVTINDKEVATETEIDIVQNGVDQNTYNIGQLASRITNLLTIIPNQATPTNPLADRDFVNSSINSLAAFPITKNAQREHFATKQELDNATTFYSGGVVRVPTKNDYTIVDNDETHNNAQTKYIYNNGWEYWTTINLKPFTEAQQKAIDSGITEELVELIQQGGSQPASETVLGTVRFWADANGYLRMSSLPYVEPTSPITGDTTYCADSLICNE